MHCRVKRDQLGFYARCAREYGDVVPVRLGRAPGLLIYHPDAIEEVLVARHRDFIKTRGVRLLRALLGDGLFVAEGDLWLRQRRLMQPAFHRQRVAAYGETMAAGSTSPRRSAPSAGTTTPSAGSPASPTSRSAAGPASASATRSR